MELYKSDPKQLTSYFQFLKIWYHSISARRIWQSLDVDFRDDDRDKILLNDVKMLWKVTFWLLFKESVKMNLFIC